MKQLRTAALLLALVSLLSVPTVYAQVTFEIPLTLTDGANTATIHFGILTGGNTCIAVTDCIGSHCEEFYPPPPPVGVFDVRFGQSTLPRPAGCYDQGSPQDFRPFTGFTQRDTFFVKQQLGGGSVMSVSWPANLSTYFSGPVTLRYFDGEANIDVNMLTSSSRTLTGIADGGFFRIIAANPLPPPAPGPCFSMSPGSVNFGNVGVGGSSTINVTVSNNGQSNPLNISAIAALAPFSIVPPGPVVIPPAGSQIFQVTFAPTASGAVSDNIVFTHDGDPSCGATSPTNLGVQGVGTSQGGSLEFSSAAVTRCDESNNNSAVLKLVGYVGQNLKALQLRVIVPTDYLANVGGVSRGSNLPSAQWNFSHVTTHGPSADTIKIVFFGNGTNSLPPGTYNDLVRFTYSTVNITGVQTTTQLSLANVLGSTPVGTNAQVIAGPNQVITILNSTSKGDVNGDDVLDILDLLMIVDHILNRITLTGDEFLRADVAPWPTGDGEVNVLDLALLQDIILNGTYPSPLPCQPVGRPSSPIIVNKGGSPTLSSNMDVKLTFHVTQAGIAVRMQNAVRVKGLQFDFGSVPSVPANVRITTLLGEGYYNLVNNMLRVLMYDQQARMLDPGDYLVGNIPFALMNPGAISIDRYVVAGELNNRIERVEVEISNETAPELPLDYMLYQNYPNPFNPTTYVKFSVPDQSDVKIAVYDLLGQEVQTLFEGPMARGTKIVEWNGQTASGVQASSGMYIYRMTAGSFVQTRKMMFLK
jgi:hypothetical protein